jgi:hypothetical protein
MERPPQGAGAAATRKILWLSFLFAILAYGVVGYLVFAPAAAASPFPNWLWPLAALCAAAAAFLLPSRMADAVPDVDAPGVRPREIVGWALAETVAIVGLVSVALGAPRGPLIVYLVSAAVLLWFLRPSD